jgi:hypothetical protein
MTLSVANQFGIEYEMIDEWWLENYLERRGRGVIELMSNICLEARRNITETSLTKDEGPPEVRIEHLQNTSKKRYFYPGLLFEFVLIKSSKTTNLNCALTEVSKLYKN